MLLDGPEGDPHRADGTTAVTAPLPGRLHDRAPKTTAPTAGDAAPTSHRCETVPLPVGVISSDRPAVRPQSERALHCRCPSTKLLPLNAGGPMEQRRMGSASLAAGAY